MEKFNQLLKKYFNLIALLLLVLLLLRTCGSDSRRLAKKIEVLTVQVDSLKNISVTKKDLKIEGLKAEKRMIQSTDRKILDVNRQSEIDKEIENLSK
jgi:low affinity Fe/Cu permease